ncbi:MAG: peroxide stress protein YaaA [Salinivirgaceae bacterium]
MLILLSPAKTLDFDNARIIEQKSYPEFPEQAAELVSVLKNFDTKALMELMKISPKLASLNVERFKTWQHLPNERTMRQAICVFSGDVYTGLQVADWNDANFEFSQEHIRILSGLYGMLRPLDYISPYRLEMGTKLHTKRGENLYQFWNNTLTSSVQKQLYAQGDNILLNLASNEYFKAIQTKKLNARIISPQFKDAKNGQYKLISFFAKKARGMMARYVVKNQITEPEKLKEFTDGGYYFNDRLSKGDQWVFTRD